MELIPGLTNDLARNCLIRLPYASLRSTLSVCKAWNSDIRSPYFHSLRKRSGYTRPVFLISQRSSDRSLVATIATYMIGVFDPEHGTITKLPLGPALPDKEHTFCRIVGVGSTVVVFISWYYEHKLATKNDEVHVFDFSTGKWRDGVVMPGPQRILFGVGSNPVNDTLLIAGGIAGGLPAAKKLLSRGNEGDSVTMMTSSLLYDVSRDTWNTMGDMKNGIMLCQVIYDDGRFHVMGGFDRAQDKILTVESLDPDTCQWSPHVEGEFFVAREDSSQQIIENGEGDVYRIYIIDNNASLDVRCGGKWEKVFHFPPHLDIVSTAIWRNKMLALHFYSGGVSVTFWNNIRESFQCSMVDLSDCFEADRRSIIDCGGMDL